MNIRVISAYSGVLTKGQIVYPGIYAGDDPRLIDAAETMIRKGFAEPTTLPVPEAAPSASAQPVPAFVADEDDVIGAEVREDVVQVIVPEDAVEPQTDYAALTFNELKELAEAAGLEVSGTGKNGAVTKADLVRALEAAEE